MRYDTFVQIAIVSFRFLDTKESGVWRVNKNSTKINRVEVLIQRPLEENPCRC